VALRQAAIVPVPFHGARGGRHPLTWGQKDIHRAFVRYSPQAAFFNLRTSLRVPPGTGLGRIADALRWAVEEYESLRTTYPQDARHGPHQLVHRDGTVALTVLDGPPGGYRPDTPLDGLGAEFDPGTELPLRCVLVTERGEPAWLVVEISHLSVDSVGCRILRQALARRLTGKDDRSAEPAHQPADRAAAENTPGAAAASRNAAAYLRRTRDAHRVPLFAPQAPDTRPAALRPRVRMTSSTLGAAVGVLSRRHRVASSSVYLTYLALLVGALAEQDSCVFHGVSSNRWVPHGGGYVGTLNQYALIGVDLADGDFAAVLRRVQAASLQAFGNALYDIDDVAAAGALDALDRVDCVLNDNRATGDQAPAQDAPTVVRELAPVPDPPEPIRRSLQLSVGATAHRPELTLTVDPRALPEADPGGLLRAVEHAAVAEAGQGTGRSAVTLLRESLAGRSPATAPGMR
jgi:Condensation domain